MLLTLTLTRPPPELGPPDYLASDLGYLLYKHPERVHQATLPFGQARVFFPEAGDERATAALLLNADPVALSRQVKADQNAPLEPYVNDRPYASGHFLAAALLDAFSTAMSGRSKERQALADTPLPLSVEIACLAPHAAPPTSQSACSSRWVTKLRPPRFPLTRFIQSGESGLICVSNCRPR